MTRPEPHDVQRTLAGHGFHVDFAAAEEIAAILADTIDPQSSHGERSEVARPVTSSHRLSA